MRDFIITAWCSVMDAEQNPLRNIPNNSTKHYVMQVLAFMWGVLFSLAIGSWTIFGATVVGHAFIIGGIFVTLSVFETAKRKPGVFQFREGYHSAGRSRGSIWVNGQRTVLPVNDPGGEHE